MTRLGPPRPADPMLLYIALVDHSETCGVCGSGGQCPHGEHLLEAYGDSERFYANEQAMIEAANGEA